MDAINVLEMRLKS